LLPDLDSNQGPADFNSKLGYLNTDINQLLITKNGLRVINRVIDIL
jgi:hypothetical protein